MAENACIQNYIPGIVLGTGTMEVNKTQKSQPSDSLHVGEGSRHE